MTVSSDGVVTATVDTATASVLLTVDFTVTGSPIHATAGNVYTITVTEQTSGHGVRGLASANAPGGVAVGIDHEAPFATALSYVATAYDVSGALMGTSTTAAITLTSATPFATWIKSLGTPTASVSPDSAGPPAWSAGITQGVLQVIGNPYPIVVSDVRQAKTTQIDVHTGSTAATAALGNLLDNIAGPYLLQFPGYGEPDRYVTIGNYTLTRPDSNAVDPMRTWTLPLTSVQRPDPVGWQVSVPGHTYADSQVRWPLYSNRTGTYASRANT